MTVALAQDRFATSPGATLAGAFDAVERWQPLRLVGRVGAIRGMTVLVDDLALPIGALVGVHRASVLEAASPGPLAGEPLARGEVVAFEGGRVSVMLLDQAVGLRTGDAVVGEQATQTAGVGPSLLGRCVDGLGRAIDGRGAIVGAIPRRLSPAPVGAMRRRRIARALHTGIRALDLFCTLGRGQRMGIFAGPGVGKSTMLGTIARRASSDVNVIALIGERGREVRDFIEHSLGPEGLARSVVVVSTGDESPLLRIRAARLACAAAEYFRDEGADVLLMMDSVTRFAHACRQVGLSVGEPPATKGYTPSVFAQLAQLLERAGAVEGVDGARGAGSITGLYTILVEGDDLTEPVADAARGILDGHVVLSRALAQRAHYPAIDVLDSVSRVADDVCDPRHVAARQGVLRLIALHKGVEDLVQIGAYARGANPETDAAIDLQPRILDLLRQGRGDAAPFEAALGALCEIDRLGREPRARGAKARA